MAWATPQPSDPKKILSGQSALRLRPKKKSFLETILTIFLLLSFAGCGGGSSESVSPASPVPTPTPAQLARTWEMGFYYTAPRYGDLDMAIENIDRFSTRSEIVMLHEQLPWDLLLDGTTSLDAILDEKEPLISYLTRVEPQGRGLKLFFMADLTNGLDRSAEPPKLVALNRHIWEPEVQQRYQAYVLAFVQRFQPDYIGLTAETNLVRQEADPAVYAAMVQAANATADALTAGGVSTPLLISVQVETAWGLLGDNAPGTYQGLETDLADFAFIDALGLSSYPYFAYAEPEDISDNYYTRLLNGRSLPAMVCEGGWPSVGIATIETSPEKQARYIARHADLLDSISAATAIQTLFTDLDLSSIPPPYPATLPLFSTLGLMRLNGSTFEAKPALTTWDALYARPRN